MQHRLLETLLAHLNIVLFVRVEKGVFQSISSLPVWLSRQLRECELTPRPSLDNNGQTSPCFALEQCFPVIENFLVDAEQVWRTSKGGHVSSGVWTEVDGNGAQRQLEARAIAVSSDEFDGAIELLTLIDASGTYDARQQVFQKAREIALANELLVVQLKNRQRSLRDTIGSRLKQETPYTVLDPDDPTGAAKTNGSAVLICRTDGSVEIANQALIDIFRLAYSAAELSKPRKHASDNLLGSADSRSLLGRWLHDAERQYPEIRRVLAAGAHWEGEFETSDERERKLWVRLTIAPVYSRADSANHYVCVANDISDIRQSTRELERMSELDHTTRLPNRRHFWRHLTALIDDALADEVPVTMLYIDLNDFKRINDRLGYSSGDHILSAIARRLNARLKEEDFLAHLGGDEFALLLPGHYTQDSLAAVCHRLLEAVARPVVCDAEQVRVSASIGMASHPADATDARTLMQCADLAMYHAKRDRAGTFCVYDESMGKAMQDWLELERDLAAAVDNRQLFVEYQPQMSLVDQASDAVPRLWPKGKPQRLEALVRWHHPERGLIMPSDFIPHAERNGQIVELGAWVLQEACRFAKRCLDRGYDIVMAVNISAMEIVRKDFLDDVKMALEQAELPARCLELELTETTVIQNLDQVSSTLKSLRTLGVKSALDDFGAGFSSFSYLQNLEVDYLKIDRSFVKDLASSAESQAITLSVIRMAHELGLGVVGEGVETEAQRDFLLLNHCDFLQGFLYCRPLSEDELLPPV